MFLYKNLFFSMSSILSIPIMLIEINGGYFPAIYRVCFMLQLYSIAWSFSDQSSFVLRNYNMDSIANPRTD